MNNLLELGVLQELTDIAIILNRAAPVTGQVVGVVDDGCCPVSVLL